MKKTTSILAIILCVFVWSNLALAKAEKWEIDKVHSNVYFDVRHIYATVHGLFNDFSGTLILDPDNRDVSSVEFEVKVDSINTNITKRDNHLRSDEFFAAKKFPVMTFKSTGVKLVEGNKHIIEGNLTIRGITKKIDIPFTYYGMKENPLKKGKIVAGFEADFTINRLDYKVGAGQFADMGVIGKDVRIIITLEVLKDK
jgi:polyisoprenoid-binding protein YceI